MDSTTICNLALAKIGDQSIMSLDDPSVEARMCKLLYDPTAQELFRIHDWNWAMSLATLAQTAAPPIADWDYSFALPVDFNRIVTLNSFGRYEPHPDFEIQGNQLLTDESSATISYVKKINDPNLFDPLFVELLAIRIASKLAKPLGGSMDIKQKLDVDFNRQLAESRRIDAADTYPRRKPLWVDSTLVQARYYGVQ